MHFEDLWEQCEQFFQTAMDGGSASTETDLNELAMKVNLYKALASREAPAESMEKIKTRAMGEILLMLTKISLKDNINTFAALKEALEYKSIEAFSEKY